MIFDTLSYATPQSLYAGQPVEEVKALNKKLSEDYNNNIQAKDKLDILASNIDVRDVDYAIKKETLEGLKNQFSELTKNGDYENAQYLIGKATKDFLTNDKLKDAQKSRQSEINYYKDINEKVKDGTYDQDDAQRALKQTKFSNKNPLEYDPTTMTSKNMFSGVSILPSKAKEIYDNAYKRIDGWKEGTIIVNGQPYTKTFKDGKGYIVNQKGVGVDLKEVYDGLSTEIKNRPDFMAYIQQKRDTDLYNNFSDENGNIKPLIAEDLIKKFDLSNEEIKSIATKGQISKNSLDNLLNPLKENNTPKTKEEILKDKETYGILKNQYDNANVDNLDQKELQNLYSNLFINDKVKDFSMPAAEKASYQKFDETYREDKFALMSTQHKLNKDLEKYKKDVNNPIFASFDNASVTETIEQKDVDKNFSNLLSTTNRLKEIENKYGKDPLTMPKDLSNEYNDLLANEKILKTSKKNVYDIMKKEGYDVINDAKNNLFGYGDNNLLAVKEFINQNPNLKNLKEVKDILKYNVDKANVRDLSDLENSLNSFKVLAENNPNLKQKVEDFISNNIDLYKKYGKDNIDNYKKSENHFKVVDFIGKSATNKEEEFFESNANKTLQLNTSIIALDETKEGNPLLKHISKELNNSVQSGTDFKTMSGTSLKEYLEEYNKKFKGKNQKNTLEIKDLKTNLATKAVNGKFGVQITLPNGQSKLFFPENQNGMADILDQLGTQYLQEGVDNNTIKKGIELKSQVNFSNLKKIIPDAHINNLSIGDVIPIDLPVDKKGYINSNGTNQKFKISVVDKLSDGKSIYSILTPDNKSIFDNYNKNLKEEQKIKNQFNSIDDLMYNLQVVELSKN